jgi:tetratricopeptide (TPR) repeat protein/tRNA A-37 threonylcarbamoyl transferase component Bud32
LRISHYELLTSIGRDGASEIYRARDRRLEREVAVKLLRREQMSDSKAVELFQREAHLASLVTHPHICAVHDSGIDDGQPYLVLEYLDGRALDDVIAEKPLSVDRALEICMQIADALSAAHRRDIVHGNLKPSNVFITTDGHVKLLELGAARAATPASQAITRIENGSRTTSIQLPKVAPAPVAEFFHAYLAPEQISGLGADPRADVFATGALLYEMITGRRAFPGDTPSEISRAIGAHEPAGARVVNPQVPAAVEAIVSRALAKDPLKRYQSAPELLEALRTVRQALHVPPAVSVKRARRTWPVAVGAVALVAVVGLAVAGTPRLWRNGARVERSTVMLSQIANGTGDPDFDGTLREAVTVYLGQSPYLDLVSDERIRGQLQLMGRDPSTRMTHDVAQEVCQRLGLQAMLEGSVSAVGRITVVALAATDCVGGTTIARQQMEVDRKEDVLRAMGTITRQVREALGESRTSLARHNVPIEEATTPSLDALKAYTEGVAKRAAGSEIDSIPFFERAISLDPRFALAYTTLSSLYGGLGETGRSQQLARQAYENREHVSERERLFITYQYHDRFTGDQTKTRETLEVWKRTYPRDYRPPNALAVLLNRLGEYDAATAEAEEAVKRNPAHAFPQSNLAYAHRGAGRFAQARAVAEQAISRNLGTGPLRRLLYQLAELDHDEAAARAQIEWAAQSPVGFDVTGARAQIAAFKGRMTEARQLFAETIAAATDRGFTQVASGYAAQAAQTEAFYGYERAAREQARDVVRVATAYEPQLRGAAALALAGLPDEGEAVVRKTRGIRPDDTLLHGAYGPVAEAAILLGRRRPTDAVEVLRSAARYERGTVAALAPAYLRGVARLEERNSAEALRDFRLVIDNRGADPFSVLIPLAQLGVARAWSAAGDVVESRKAYEAVLRTWEHSDPDLPVKLAARRELAQLR